MNNPVTIAYDLDGVLLPDCEHIPNLGDERAFFTMLTYIRPLFIPPHAHTIIITARPTKFAGLTRAWAYKYLGHHALYQDIKDGEDPAEYKARTLDRYLLRDVTTYIESNPLIVVKMRTLTTKNVIYFNDIITKNIHNIKSENNSIFEHSNT